MEDFQVQSTITTGLAAGTYTVTVTDNKGCTSTQVVTITQPAAALSSSIGSQTNVLCYGNSTGAVTISATGGTTVYQYKLDGGAYQSSSTFTGLAAGTYTITIKDANECTTTQVVTITQPAAALSASIGSQTNVLCYGNSTGAVTISATGGTTVYQYKLDGGAYQSSSTFTGLAAGTYTITIKDANECTTTQVVTITQPAAALSASIGSQTNVLCYGNSTGAVTISATGGTTVYQYKLDGGAYQSSSTFTGLAAGTYTITIKDANECTTTQVVTITQPAAALSASIGSQTNVLCYGNSTGAVTISATGGTTVYQYKLDGGAYQSSSTFTGLAAGTYTITIKDANECTTTQVVTITQPAAALSASIGSQTNVLCYGNSTGAVTISATGGTTVYQYKLDGGAYQSSSTFTGLAAGTYTITIKDANECTTTQVVTITQPAAALSASIGSQTNVLCYGNSTGAVTISATGGTTVYQYKLDGGAYQSSSTFTGLAAGTYTITIKDANECTTTQVVTITQPAAALSASIGSQTNVLCYGNSTGAVTISATGGTTVYQYKLDGGAYQSSSTFTGLAAGTYTITIKDANECLTTQVVTITQPAAALSASITNLISVDCYGNSTGSSTTLANGGTIPYTYSWNTTPIQTTATATGLSAGTYTVTVTDSNACTTISNVTITQPTALSASIGSQTNVLCYGNSTGAVTISATGGTTVYQYKLDGGAYQSSSTFTGLAAGTYTITIKDANECTTTQVVTITQPAAALSASIGSQTNVLCYGNSTGAVTISATGGTTVYQYKLDGGAYQSSSTFTGLAAGTYTITIKDANECSTTQVVTITQPAAALSASIGSQTNVLCYGKSTGSATASANGGTSPYSYSWTTIPIQAAITATGLSAGTYKVIVTDFNSCKDSTSVIITQPSAPQPPPISGGNQTECEKLPIQTLTATATGGTITWYDSATGGSIVVSPILNSVGSVTYYAESSNGVCSSESRTPVVLTIVAAPAAPVSNGNKIECQQIPTQSITASASGLNITWYDSLTGGTLVTFPTLNSVGSITFYAESNSAGCKSLSRTGVSLTIHPKPILQPISGVSAICVNDSTTLVNDSIGGFWKSSDTTIATISNSGVVIGHADGTINISYLYTDTNGCSDTVYHMLTVHLTPAIPTITANGPTEFCYGDSVKLCSSSLTGNQWYKNGVLINGATNQKLTVIESGDYTVLILDGNGCSSNSPSEAFTIIVNPLPLTPIISKNNASAICSGDSVILTSSLNDFYQWYKNGLILVGKTNQNLTVQDSGIYKVVVTNIYGCNATSSNEIIQIKATSNSTSSVIICSNELPFIWNGNNYNSSGVYFVILTNAVGCDSTATLNLTVKATSSSITNISVCSNQVPFVWNGNNYSVNGFYDVHFINAVGCDSIATLDLTVLSTSSSLTTISICSSDAPYTWNGVDYSTTGVYTASFTNSVGCDSIATLDLTIKAISRSTTTAIICSSNTPYTWNGNNYNTTGHYDVYFTNAVGCDSIATLDLTVLQTTSSTSTESVCSNQLPFIWNGKYYNLTGTYSVMLTNAEGCDSTANLHLTVLSTSSSTTSVSVCSNQVPFVWNGNNYSVNGFYDVHFINAVGCDSTATLDLTILSTSSSLTTVSICSTYVPYTWNGIDYSTTGVYTAMFTNAAGCDSIATLELTIKAISRSTTTAIICSSNTPYTWNGNNYNTTGHYDVYFTSAVGCDSIATLDLTVLQTTSSTSIVSVCSNQVPFVWNGNYYNLTGTYSVALTNAVGCDSTATLDLTVLSTSSSLTTVSICSSDAPYTWNGLDYSTTGVYTAIVYKCSRL